jgi:hypothetical protein
MLVHATLCSILLAAAPVVPESLEWAGRFANAIQSDAKDRERSQEAVVLDIAMKGALDDAARRADAVEGWRRGVAYAEIAKLLAKSGRVTEAKSLLSKAAAVAAANDGWQGPRIEAHMAQVQVLVGGVEAVPTTERLAQEDELQYRGLPAVLRGNAHAARGEFAAAMAQLDAAAQDRAIEVAWPLTLAYLDVARLPKLRPEERLRALDAARAAASRSEEIVSRLDTMELVADAYREAGFRDRAFGLLDEFHTMLVKLSDAAILKAPFLAGEARVRARLGDRQGAARLLADAARIGSQAYPIDRPAVLANVAAGYHVAGEASKAASTLEEAFAAADDLANARPRALAFVEIGRVLGRFDVPVSAPVRARFDAGLNGLKAPW